MQKLLLKSLITAAVVITFGPASAQTPAENPATPAPQPEKQAPEVERHLQVFDTLDFDVFSNQKWEQHDSRIHR